MTKPSTMSMLSSSARVWATSGKYHPVERRGPAGPLATVKCSAAAEDAVDGPAPRGCRQPPSPRGFGGRDGVSTDGTRVAVGQGLSESAKPDPPREVSVRRVLCKRRGAIGDQSTRVPAAARWPAEPSRRPWRHRRRTGQRRHAAADRGGRQLPSCLGDALLLTLCLLMDLPHEGSV